MDMPPSNGRARPLRIAVAEHDPSLRRSYEEALVALGHQAHAVGTGQDLLDFCAVARPDLVITDSRLPDMDGFQAVETVCRDHPLPAIVVAGPGDCVLGERDVPRHVFAWLTRPVKTFAPAIAVALHHFGRQQALERQAEDLRRELEDHKVIERAKGLLMRYAGLTEKDAHQRLGKVSRDRQRRLVEVAEAIVAAGELFGELERATSERGQGGRGRPQACRRGKNLAGGNGRAGRRFGQPSPNGNGNYPPPSNPPEVTERSGG